MHKTFVLDLVKEHIVIQQKLNKKLEQIINNEFPEI